MYVKEMWVYVTIKNTHFMDMLLYRLHQDQIIIIIYVYCRALGLPTADLTYDDCKLMIRARQMNLPHFDDIVEIEKLRREIG